jgi:hypothetical protein
MNAEKIADALVAPLIAEADRALNRALVDLVREVGRLRRLQTTPEFRLFIIAHERQEQAARAGRR